MLASILSALELAVQYGPAMVKAVMQIAADAKSALSSGDQATLDAALAKIRSENDALFIQVDAELAQAAMA